MKTLFQITITTLFLLFTLPVVAQNNTEKGCLAGNCTNGYTVVEYPNKSRYIGLFKDGMKHGTGLLLNLSDNVYLIGEWANDKQNGFSKIYTLDNELIFSGELKDGKPIKTYSELDIEEGCTLGDCANGFGHYKWKNGDVHIGEFRDNIQQGEGTITWSDGSKHIGNFKAGVQNGYGRYFDVNGNIAMEGIFVDGQYIEGSNTEKNYTENKKCLSGNCIDGYGVYIETFTPGWEDGYQDYVNTFEVRYEGFWKGGKKHGFGFHEDRMANKYVGEFNNNEVTGIGVINFANGDMYSGELEDGLMHGQGTMKYADGTIYTGSWDYGKKVD